MDNLGKHNLNFNTNPFENLQLENELLKLKLRAETGSEPNFTGKIPLEIQNTFLKNIIAFENKLSKASLKSVFEVLNKPVFPLASDLNDHEIEITLGNLIKLMNQKQLALVFLGKYDARTKYKFITEELFKEEVLDSLNEGMICHFLYEEFHPNHTLEIERITHLFISDWMNQNINQNHPYLAETNTSPTGKILRKDEIASKINKLFDSFSVFKTYHYSINDIKFELSKKTGMGHTEGYLKYVAVLNDNEEIVFEGPFKLYFNLEFDCWSIYYFVFPGFK